MRATGVFEKQSDGSREKCGELEFERFEERGQRKALQAPLPWKDVSVKENRERKSG